MADRSARLTDPAELVAYLTVQAAALTLELHRQRVDRPSPDGAEPSRPAADDPGTLHRDLGAALALFLLLRWGMAKAGRSERRALTDLAGNRRLLLAQAIVFALVELRHQLVVDQPLPLRRSQPRGGELCHVRGVYSGRAADLPVSAEGDDGKRWTSIAGGSGGLRLWSRFYHLGGRGPDDWQRQRHVCRDVSVRSLSLAVRCLRGLELGGRGRRLGGLCFDRFSAKQAVAGSVDNDSSPLASPFQWLPC